MRLRIIFLLKNKGAVLPFHHQNLIAQLVEQLVHDDFSFNESFISFSGVKGQTKVSRDGLMYFSKRVTIVFSGLEEHKLLVLLQRLFAVSQHKLGNLLLEPEYIEQEILNDLPDKMRYLCISPLVINQFTENEKSKAFVSPFTDEFSDWLYESTLNRMELSGLYSPEDFVKFNKFQFVPDDSYLEKINQNDKKFARIYTLFKDGDYKEIRGYTLPFTLYAHPQIQSFITQAGFGEYTTAGFGMLDLVESDRYKQIAPFSPELARVER